jgi:nucleotide-binding universal stress UspA family protein
MKILLAVDGSQFSRDATSYLVGLARELKKKPDVELVTVHLPVPKLPGMGMVVGRNQVASYYEEEGQANLADARRRLTAAGVKHRSQVLVGKIAETIASHAEKTRCTLVVCGARGRGAVGKMVLGSTADRLLQISSIPVLLVR